MQPHSDGARHLWFSGVRVIVHVDAEQSQGRLGVWESEEWRGVRLPLHVHTREDEQVVVLEGEILVRVGDATHRLTAGATLALARGVPHAHLVISARARLLTVAVPGGFERLFTELGVPALPGMAAPPPPDDETRAAAVRRLGVEVVGPPLAFDAE
ncbi:MAG TPA: cupin domain-containing protein [Solirubrobacteraceae bacterium]